MDKKMMESLPCKCSEEERKRIREEHNVGTCKTVCDKYKKWKVEYDKWKEAETSRRKKFNDIYKVKLDSIHGTGRR